MKATRGISNFRQGLLAFAATLILTSCGSGDGGDSGGGLGGGSISLNVQVNSATRITLTWGKPSGGVSVSPYVVARQDAQSTSNIDSTTALTYIVAGLWPGTQYCFVIKNPLTGNIMSNTACATTQADTSAPTTPIGLASTAISPAEVELSWMLSSDDNRVAAYNVFRDGVLLTSSESVAMLDSSAVPGATHCYTVSAYDAAANESSLSAESCATLPADMEDPTVPTAVSAILNKANAQTSITISWTASEDDGVVSYYRVFRNSAYLADAIDTTHEDSNLAIGTSYCYTISAVDAAGKESAQSGPACAREDFPTQALGAFDVRYASIAVDNNDTAHIVYKQNIYDRGLSAFRIPLSYIQLQFGQAPSSQVLAEGAETFFFSDAYPLAIALDPSGAIHLAHKINNPPSAEQVEHLQVSPGSTIRETIQQSTDQMSAIALGIDSTGAMHACYDLSNILYYANNIGGAWSSSDVSTLIPNTAGNICDIAIASDDSIHISFTEKLSRNLQYLSNTSGSWSIDTLDVHSGNIVHTSRSTSIALDDNDKVHIAYFHDYADNDLEYATNVTGTWQTSKIDSIGDVGYDCDLAVDSSGAVHIVYEDHTTAKLLKYATNRAGTWTTSILATVGNGNTALALDALGQVHVVYTSVDDELIYTTNQN